MPNGVVAPGKVLPAPSNSLVLAPMIGLIKLEARPAASQRFSAQARLVNSQRNAIPIREFFVNSRREIDRCVAGLMHFIVTPISFRQSV